MAKSQIIEHLQSFSVEDLRTVAARRGVMLTPDATRARQTLLTTLSRALERYDGVYSAVAQLNQGELAALRHVIAAGTKASLSRLVAESGAPKERALLALEGLRLWGLVFPVGNWEHLFIPPQTQAGGYQAGGSKSPAVTAQDFVVPAISTVPEIRGKGRDGTWSWDLAEFLARISRGRMKLTQAQRMNRRDMKTMEAAFGIQAAGYLAFMECICISFRLLKTHRRGSDEILGATSAADDYLGQSELTRLQFAHLSWVDMRGFPETAAGDPADADYIPVTLPQQRAGIGRLMALIAAGESASVKDLAWAMHWNAPLAYSQWDQQKDPYRCTARLLRSLYWLGLVGLDDTESPNWAYRTPLGQNVILRRGQVDPSTLPPLVPEEARFFIQPNAEIFAPPNLSPRTYFNLRRLTGEKKGGPAGMFPITAESLRRAQDNGLEPADILNFLEKFSRTGLPSSVKSLVETAGRQHGRIRLVPADYVLLTDDAMLLEELKRLKTIEPLLRVGLTERSITVRDEDIAELQRNLRARGYAPRNEAELIEGPPLPADVDAGVAQVDLGSTLEAVARLAENEGIDPDIALREVLEVAQQVAEAAPQTVPMSLKRVDTAEEIRALLEAAVQNEWVVMIGYSKAKGVAAEEIEVWPTHLGGAIVDGYDPELDDDRTFPLNRISWARLTGEAFEFDEDYDLDDDDDDDGPSLADLLPLFPR